MRYYQTLAYYTFNIEYAYMFNWITIHIGLHLIALFYLQEIQVYIKMIVSNTVYV